MHYFYMNRIRQVFLVMVMWAVISCGGLHFSSSAFDRDVAIKTTAISLLQKADGSYSSHETEVEALKSDVLKALENEKLRKGNTSTVAMWNEVINGQGNLFDLLNKWKTSGQLSKTMVEQSTIQIDRLLTSIADLENTKKR